MNWNFSQDKPIFQQIVDRITLDIISGEYQPGQRLAAVREFAVTAGVNPNTMQRAMATLEETGLIFSKRGDGRFVTEDENRILSAKENYVITCCESLAKKLHFIGLTDEMIISAVQNNLMKGYNDKS